MTHGLDVTKFAYLAGIIDGEGYIAIVRYRPNGPNTKWQRRLSLQVGNTKPELILWLKENFGGHVSPHRRNDRSSRRARPLWVWSLSGGNLMRRLLENVLPYLILKKAHAVLALEFAATMNRKAHAHGVPDEVTAKRIELADRIRALNKRGVA